MKKEICPIHKIKLISYIREDVSRWFSETDFNYFEDFYCPKCENHQNQTKSQSKPEKIR